MRGAGAGRTTIDATGLAVGVSFGGTDPKSPTVLDRATVTGAATCVAVGSGATGVQLTHLVVRDCVTAGISVAAGGGAAIANATVATNGIGVDATGIATIKNSLVTGNDVGLDSEGTGDLASSYDDLFGNTTDYKGLVAGTGDLAAAVTFVSLSAHDLTLSGPQPSTDQGDPADAVGEEPTPNGTRINLGAFGGTADAELSTPAAVTGDPSPTPTPSTPTALPPGEIPAHQIGEAAGGCALGGRDGWFRDILDVGPGGARDRPPSDPRSIVAVARGSAACYPCGSRGGDVCRCANERWTINGRVGRAKRTPRRGSAAFAVSDLGQRDALRVARL